MSLRAIWITVLVLLLLAFSRSALGAGTVRTVPSDEFSTIQSALDASVEADVVAVLPGVYGECLVLPAGVGLVGAGAAATVLVPISKAGDVAVTCLPAAGTGSHITGFTFGRFAAGITGAGAGLTVRDCTFAETSVGIAVEGSCTVTGCTFYRNSIVGLSVAPLPDGAACTVTITGNSFARWAAPTLDLAGCGGTVSGNSFTLAPRVEQSKILPPVLMATQPCGLQVLGNSSTLGAGDFVVVDPAGPCVVGYNTLAPGSIQAYTTGVPPVAGLDIVGNALDSHGILVTGLPCSIRGNTFDGGLGPAIYHDGQGSQSVEIIGNAVSSYQVGIWLVSSPGATVSGNSVTQSGWAGLIASDSGGEVTANSFFANGGGKLGSGAALVATGSTGLAITGNQVVQNGCGPNGTVYLEGGQVQFLGNLVSGNGGALSVVGSGGDVVVANNVVTGASLVPHAVELTAAGGRVRFTNNTVVANLCAGIGLAEEALPYGVTVSNSIFWGNGGCDIDAVGVVPVQLGHVDHCIVGVASQEAVLGTGCVSADPLLVDPAAGDYHLAAGSPAIDAGTGPALPGSVATDFYGGARVMGSSVDIGAAEFQVAVPTPASVVEDIAGYVASGAIDSAALAGELADRMQAADRLATGGNTNAAGNVMRALINQVRAQRGKHISAEVADALAAAIQQVIDNL